MTMNLAAGRKWMGWTGGVILGALLAAGAGIAWAVESGVIHACANNGNGSLRLVTGDAACHANETAISWNAVGPVGPAGPTGPTGPTGPAGEAGPPGTAVAWAFVSGFDNPWISEDGALNVPASSVSAAVDNPGVVCFHDLPFVIHSMMAVPVGVTGRAQDNVISLTVNPWAIGQGCPGYPDFDHSAFVTGWNSQPYDGPQVPRPATNEGFMVWFQ